MEPLLLDEIPPNLADIAAEVIQAAERIGGRLHPTTLSSISSLVRIMNCYYSNLIEGHRTRPRDIEAALKSGGNEITSHMPDDPTGERLLKLALAHIETQRWIDGLHQTGSLSTPADTDFIRNVHRTFYANLPSEFREIRHRQSQVVRLMVAGQMRTAGEEVDVGRHIPPCGGDAVDACMTAYSKRYSSLGSASLGPVQKLCGIAAAHHRLLYVHPFDDGNGRVARLVTHAMMLDAGFGAHGLWSMSRGFARGIPIGAPRRPACLSMYDGAHPSQQYKRMMAHADQTRLGDLDGRWSLSRKRLQEFCEWFLSIALDQIKFMGSHFQLEDLTRNLLQFYVPRRRLDDRLGKVLVELVRLGELPRGSVKTILNVSQRSATQFISNLLEDGIVKSSSHRDVLRLHVGLEAAEILFPGLFGVEVFHEDTSRVVVEPS